MDILPTAFNALKKYHQFIVYSIINNPSNVNKKIKRPCCPKTGVVWDAHDQSIWVDFETASTACKFLGESYGVGFVLTESDPFFLLDIDSCYEESTGWSELSKTLLQRLAGAAIEVSSSGRGLHIIASCKSFEHGCRNDKLGLEFYTSKRFIALTGIHAAGDASLDFTEALQEINSEYFVSAGAEIDKDWWSDKPMEEWNGPKDDDELIRMACASKSMKAKFGQNTSATFEDLWENNEAELSKFYPHETEPYNRSSADAALAQHLAFWTGCNAERMLTLMKRSKLYREKWEREDYLPRTIRNARGKNSNCFSYKKQDSTKTEDKGQTVGTSGGGFLTIQEQIDYYQGCTYVCHENSILIPGGYLLDRDRFNVMYGGSIFVLDHNNAKTTNKAWDAFTLSNGMKFPKVNSSTFRPDLPFGHVFDKDGELVVNRYWPYKCKAVEGDVTPMMNHIQLLLPNKKDQDIIINYIAALVQYIGKKFKWCLVLQGTQGNGKTFFSRLVAYIIGDRYTQCPRAEEIANKFNDWEEGTIFVSIEDAYYPDSRAEIMETLKPMLDLERRMIEGKGRKKVMKDICCNYIINTNHKDALRKSKDDRRFAIFYTAQQSVEDLGRDGMLGDYFPELYGWANNGGFAAMAHFFLNYPIQDAFNPLKYTRAPLTSTTDAAIQHGFGRVEHEILEAVESEKVGFKGGWICSAPLDLLLKEIGADKRIARNKRRDLLQAIGYDWHPHLREGRTPTVMPGESFKPRLYIKNGHPDCDITDSKLIVKAYKDAQLL